MTYQTLTWTVDADGIATLTLDRPDALNAFDLTMAHELFQVFTTDAHDDAVRAVVVTGAGRAFCAGMDLNSEGNVFGLDESLTFTPEEFRSHYDEAPYAEGVRDTGGKVTLAIHALPKPVIAAINGPAVGIGATMTLAMDLRLASTEARIGFVFGRLGIVPRPARAGSCRGSSASSRPSSGSTRPTSSPPSRPTPAGWCAACTSPTTCCRPPTSSPGRSSGTALRSRSAWPSSCSTATAPPPTRSRRT